ncbi:MAG: hypothetical protein V1755_11040 [Chloroflexota bacterium]
MTGQLKKFAALATILLLTACTLPGIQAQPSLSPIDQASTIVAGTLQAAGVSTSSAASGVTPSVTPAPATPTTKPSLYINTNGARCRSGPGPNFQEIASYNTGTTVDLIAKDTADGYWLVKDPSSGNSCWVQVQDASPGGSFELLPEITPQAVSQSAPGRPSRGNWNYSCDNTSLTMLLGWNAPTGTVNGYRVYRFGTLLTDLPASTTSYQETVPFTYGSNMNYAVEAYNDAGAGQQVIWDFNCP